MANIKTLIEQLDKAIELTNQIDYSTVKKEELVKAFIAQTGLVKTLRDKFVQLESIGVDFL